jgi:hypothetical protein
VHQFWRRIGLRCFGIEGIQSCRGAFCGLNGCVDVAVSQDTYWLLTDGYNSGEQVLREGNIQIRRKGI